MLALAAFVLVSWWATHGLPGRWGCALCVLTRYVCHPNQGEPVAAGFIKPSLGCPHAETAPRTHTRSHEHTIPPPGYMSGAQPVWGAAHTQIYHSPSGFIWDSHCCISMSGAALFQHCFHLSLFHLQGKG